jgi:hypothetical protein
MSRHLLLGILSLTAAYGGLWGGAYVIGHLKPGSWAAFPAFFTAIALCFGGVIFAILSFIKYSDRK